MNKSNFMERCIFFLMLLLACLTWGAPEAVLAGNWKTVKTKYLNIHYENEADLRKFDSEIEFDENTTGFSWASSSTDFNGRLAAKMDGLFQKVQLILDMRKPFTVNVRLHSGKSALDEAYFKIYKQKKTLRAWYLYEFNTIYLNVNDLFAGMLAHEIAHAIVDNYLAIRPPRATAEILARYVDEHLNERAKTY